MKHKDVLSELKKYGQPMENIALKAVTVHPLADDYIILAKLGIRSSECTSCGVWWAFERHLFHVSICNNAQTQGVNLFRNEDCGIKTHSFYVKTSVAEINSKAVVRVLRFLQHWLATHRDVLYFPTYRIIRVSHRDVLHKSDS